MAAEAAFTTGTMGTRFAGGQCRHVSPTGLASHGSLNGRGGGRLGQFGDGDSRAGIAAGKDSGLGGLDGGAGSAGRRQRRQARQ